MTPDVTVIHAQKADWKGNVLLWGILGVQKEAALAAKRVVATVEERVEQLDAPPNACILPGWVVSAVSEVPRGQHRLTRMGTTKGTTCSIAPGTQFRGSGTRSVRGLRNTLSERKTLRNICACWPSGMRKRCVNECRLHVRRDDDSVGGTDATERGGVFCGDRIAIYGSKSGAPDACADAVLVYESGPIGAKPSVLPLSIGDGDLAETADTVVSTPEIFRYWLQGGRIDVGFLGAAQLDRFANINTTVVGSYGKPKVRLPGAGGAPEISSSAKEVLIIVKQSKRTLVEKLDFVTSVGFLTGGNSRARAGLTGKGPVAVITDLCILRPDEITRELKVASIHPGVDREAVEANTGWPIQFEKNCGETEKPGRTNCRCCGI